MFELFAQALSECRTLPSCGDGDLQVAAPRDRRIKEIAEFRHVYDVAQDAASLGFFKDLFVERSR